MLKVVPYINFVNNCREAMTFYSECLGAKLVMQTVGESPMAAQMPAEAHSSILHSSIEKDGVALLYASDMAEQGMKPGETPQICVTCDKSEIKAIYAKFTAGGKIRHELKEEFFGSYGDLTDKFGVNWMFQAS